MVQCQIPTVSITAGKLGFTWKWNSWGSKAQFLSFVKIFNFDKTFRSTPLSTLVTDRGNSLPQLLSVLMTKECSSTSVREHWEHLFRSKEHFCGGGERAYERARCQNSARSQSWTGTTKGSWQEEIIHFLEKFSLLRNTHVEIERWKALYTL